MTLFMARKPGEQGWKEISISNQQEIDAFIGEWADSIELGMGIHSHMSNAISGFDHVDRINLVVSYGGAAYPIYGNVLLAGTNEEGEPIPLKQDQLKFLEASSHSLAMPSGLKLMHLFPKGFHHSQMEPLRLLGTLLSERILVNEHSIYSHTKTV